MPVKNQQSKQPLTLLPGKARMLGLEPPPAILAHNRSGKVSIGVNPVCSLRFSCRRSSLLFFITRPPSVLRKVLGCCFKNTGPSRLTINGLHITPTTFSFGEASLPTELESGAYFSIQVGFDGESFDGTTGNITVGTSEGCAQFPVTGLAARDGLVTYSDLAIDFGDVVAGNDKTREIEILVQRIPTFSPSKFEGFSASPEGTFDVVTSPVEPAVPESCEYLKVAVRFSAFPGAGSTEGSLSWTVTTATPEGDAEAIAFIPLFGTSVTGAVPLDGGL